MRFLIILLTILSLTDVQAAWRFSAPKGKFKGLCSLENSISVKGKTRVSVILVYYTTENYMNPILNQIADPQSVSVLFATNNRKVMEGQAAHLQGPDLDREFMNYQRVEFRGRPMMFYTAGYRLQKIILDNLKFGNDMKILVPLKKFGATEFVIKPFSINKYKQFVQCTEKL